MKNRDEENGEARALSDEGWFINLDRRIARRTFSPWKAIAFRMLAFGYPAKEIATLLGLDSHTVYNWIKREDATGLSASQICEMETRLWMRRFGVSRTTEQTEELENKAQEGVRRALDRVLLEIDKPDITPSQLKALTGALKDISASVKSLKARVLETDPSLVGGGADPIGPTHSPPPSPGSGAAASAHSDGDNSPDEDE